MLYAVNERGGWRAIESEHDILPGETVQSSMPTISQEVLLADAKSNASVRIANYTKMMRMKIARISDETAMSSWPVKLLIAQAIIAGTATTVQVAAFEAEIAKRGVTGETVATFAQKVIANAAAFTYAAGIIDGLDRKVRTLVAAAETVEAVEVALAQVKAEAEAEYVKLTA
jgi:hypothetical protein